MLGPEAGSVGQVELDCDDLDEARELAANLISPLGHELLADGRFVARFEARWGEHLDDDEFEDAGYEDA